MAEKKAASKAAEPERNDDGTITDKGSDEALLSSLDSVQERFDHEQEQGFRGTKVDPTPNHAYTVAGVTAGEPTPETDAELASKVAASQRHVGGGQSAFTAEREPGEKSSDKDE